MLKHHALHNICNHLLFFHDNKCTLTALNGKLNREMANFKILLQLQLRKLWCCSMLEYFLNIAVSRRLFFFYQKITIWKKAFFKETQSNSLDFKIIFESNVYPVVQERLLQHCNSFKTWHFSHVWINWRVWSTLHTLYKFTFQMVLNLHPELCSVKIACFMFTTLQLHNLRREKAKLQIGRINYSLVLQVHLTHMRVRDNTSDCHKT